MMRLKIIIAGIIAFSSVKQEVAQFAEEKCVDQCSQVVDPVCGRIIISSGSVTYRVFHNLCALLHERCRLSNPESEEVVKQVPASLCGIEKPVVSSRRVSDFSIVGSYQACNHTCPTYCIDTYEPACAQVWYADNPDKSFHRPMVNHCHIDLLSCALSLNVTIVPFANCFKNNGQLLFMSQIAALKSLNLLDGGNDETVH